MLIQIQVYPTRFVYRFTKHTQNDTWGLVERECVFWHMSEQRFPSFQLIGDNTKTYVTKGQDLSEFFYYLLLGILK